MEKKKYITPSLEVEIFKEASVLTSISENPDTGVDPFANGKEF
ncbi:MAG: hypothetical protein ACLUH5_10395 [Eubacterium sp.]